MKRILGILAVAIIAAFFVAPATAATTYNMLQTASFGVALTGQASNAVVTATDSTGTQRVGSGEGNEPTITEVPSGSGCYQAVLPLDATWGSLVVDWTITGQSGVAATTTLANFAPDVASGYTATLAGGIGTTNTSAAKLQFDGSDNVKSTPQTGVTVTTNSDKTGYSLTQAFPPRFSSLGIDASGDVTFNNSSVAASNLPADYLSTAEQNYLSGAATGTALSSLSTKVGTPAGASVSADIATANTGISSVTSTLATVNTNTTPITFYIAGSHTISGTAETLTLQQMTLLYSSELVGDHNAGAVSGNSQTVTYYLPGRTQVSGNVVETVTINTSTGQVVSRLIAQPFPSGTGG